MPYVLYKGFQLFPSHEGSMLVCTSCVSLEFLDVVQVCSVPFFNVAALLYIFTVCSSVIIGLLYFFLFIEFSSYVVVFLYFPLNEKYY